MIQWQGGLRMLLALFPLAAGAQSGPYLVRLPNGAPAEAHRRAERRPEPIDLAGLEARTRAYEERVARRGTLAEVSAGRDLGGIVAEAQRHLARPGGADLGAAAERVEQAQALLRDQVASMRRHFAALGRSQERSEHAAVLRPRLARQAAELEKRQEIVTETLGAIREGIEERRDGGLWATVSSAVRRLVGRDPETRVADVRAALEQWGATRRSTTLSAQVGNEGLTYVTWGGQRNAMPQGTVTAAYEGGAAQITLEDTSAGQETEPSDDLLAKAQELKTAGAIANFVRNDLRLEWYRGCLKGAVETLREGGGNDADLAAVTIALLRANGIPARYVYGTIELPVGKAADLMGLMDGAALAAFYAAPASWVPPAETRDLVIKVLSAAGVPYEPILSGGRLSAVRIPHYWLEAYVAYSDYRGGGRERGARQWVALEPSIPGGAKYEVTPPKVDVLSLIAGGADGLTDEYLAGFAGSPLELFRAKAAAGLQSRGLDPDAGRRQVLQRREVLSILPGTLPFKVAAIHAEYAVLPDGSKHQARIRVEDESGVDLDVSLPLHKVVGRRTALLYLPATEADADLIVASGGYWDAPAAVVQVNATLRIDGASIAQAIRPAGLGEPQRWSIEFTDPGGTVRHVTNPVIAGNLIAIGFGGPRDGYVEGAPFHEGDHDGPAVRFSAAQVAAYANAWSDGEEELARALQVLRVHPTANVTLYQSQLQVDQVLGVRQRVRWSGLAVDADLRPMVPVELVPGHARDLFRLSGHEGSYQEAAVLSRGLGVPSISTVTLLQRASEDGVPVLEVTQANRDATLPRLVAQQAILDDVAQNLARGRTVRILSRPITVEDWTGTGYVATDPRTGEAGYFLSGELAGGVTVRSPLRWADQANLYVFQFSNPSEEETISYLEANGNGSISNVAKVRDTDGVSLVVGRADPVALTVVVISQWTGKECLKWSADGQNCVVWSGSKRFAARVKEAPVTFERFSEAECAIGKTLAEADGLFHGPAAQVISRIHAAAHQGDTEGQATGAKVVYTDKDGYARVYLAPDPVIASHTTGILLPGPPGGNPVLGGAMSIMATVKGVRPHGTGASYDLRLLEPFTIVVTPAAIADLEPGVGPDLYGATGGVEYATPLVVRAVDAFGNMLSNEAVLWGDDSGGRFINIEALGAAGIESFAAKVLNPVDPSQVPYFQQWTGPFLPLQVGYIPPYTVGLVTVSAKSGSFSEDFRLHLQAGDRYYLAVKMDRDTFTSGVTGTWFASPISATVFRRWPDGWVPVRPGDPGVSEVLVTSTTYRTSDNSVLDAKSTAGSLTFEPSGQVVIRPQYLVDGDRQSTIIEATVSDELGDQVGCSESWLVPARASRVKLSFARLSTVLDTIPIEGVMPARTTDNGLVVTVVNPADQTVFLRAEQAKATLLTTLSPTAMTEAYAPPGLLALPPGTSRVTYPINNPAAGPGTYGSRLPPPGEVGFEVWGYNKTPTSRTGPISMELLNQDASVSHLMEAREGLAGDHSGGAWVRFVGGWNCTYYIADQRFECFNDANREDRFVQSKGPNNVVTNQTPYSGYYLRETDPKTGALVWQDLTCVNNPCAQCLHAHNPDRGRGTIPEGSYTIGEGFLDPVRPFMTYRLTILGRLERCDPETYKAGAPHGRDGFLIHHGTTYPSVWSEGCIILPDPASRDTLNKYGGGTLVVKASQAPFDPASCPDPGFGLQTDLSSQPAQEQCKGLQ